MKSNDEIFDWIMTYEDEALQHMREEVIKTAEYNFGERGRKVAESYYKKIDGEEDFENDIVDEDCDDCKERAKRLIELSDTLSVFSESLTSDLYSKLIKDINVEFAKSSLDDFLNGLVQTIKDNTCYQFDPEKLKLRLLLEISKKESENGNQSGQESENKT